MKILKTLLASVILTVGAVNSVSASNTPTSVYSETPAKTICIKHPSAADANAFFAKTTVLMFEVYKAGSKDEVAKIIKTLKADANIESCNEGTLTGDYQAITINLKSAKDKAYFITLFKKAGLNHIKINNNPVVEVDKM